MFFRGLMMRLKIIYGLLLFCAVHVFAVVTIDFDAATGPAAHVGDTTVLVDIAADGSASLNSISSVGSANAAAVVSGSVSGAPGSPYSLTVFVANSNGRQTSIGLMGVGNNHIDPGETMSFSFNVDNAPVGTELETVSIAVVPGLDTADGTISDAGSGSVGISFSDMGREDFSTALLDTTVMQGDGLVNNVDLNGGTISSYQFAAISFDTINGIPPPVLPSIASFSADPVYIPTGGVSQLSWSVLDADGVSILPLVGDVATSGSTNVLPPVSTTFELVATNENGAVTGLVNVVVGEQPPNFIFIAIDDLKPICGFMAEDPGNFLNRIYPDPAKLQEIRAILTPNIDALASGGIGFHRAYCPQTVCGPSRNAIMTGYRPHESGITANAQPTFRDPQFPEWLRTCTTLPQYLRDNGYTTAGAGKIFHTPEDSYADWTGATINGTFYNSWTMWFNGVPSTGNSGSRSMSPWSPKNKYPGSIMVFGYDDGPLVGQGDYATANFIGNLLQNNEATHGSRSVTISPDNPFFLACGIFRPHLPFYMPKYLLDLFDVDDITASRAMLDAFYADTVDAPGSGSLNSGDMFEMRDHGNAYGASLSPPVAEGDVRAYKETVRHYLAAAALADRCVGHLLDKLAASPYADNTIVVLWSDHGWYLGEKYLWRKTRLFEEAANCVLVIRDPRPGAHGDAAGTQSFRTVSLQDLYPTMATMAGLTVPSHVAGYDLSPLLANPKRPWNIPAQSSDGVGASIRFGRWSYIDRFGIQLYDLANDPNEITNLAGNPDYADVQAMMANMLQRSVNNDPFHDRDDPSFESWQLGQWGWFTNRLAGANDNPDGDLFTNAQEYYFFGDPHVADELAGGLKGVRSNGQLGLTFDLRDLDPAALYQVEQSTNLVDWVSVWSSDDAEALDAATVSGAGTGQRSVQVNAATTNNAAYYRARATSL